MTGWTLWWTQPLLLFAGIMAPSSPRALDTLYAMPSWLEVTLLAASTLAFAVLAVAIIIGALKVVDMAIDWLRPGGDR